MPSSSFSFVSLYSKYIRRCFTSAGLCSQALSVDKDGETTMHFWGPRKVEAAQKPSLVLIHGFGPAATWQWCRRWSSWPHTSIWYSSEGRTRRSEMFQATSVGKLWGRKIPRGGDQLWGMVAKMLGKEGVQKVVIASSGVNMTMISCCLLNRTNCENWSHVLRCKFHLFFFFLTLF